MSEKVKMACSGCNCVFEYTADDVQRSKGLYIGTQWCSAQEDTYIRFVECPECFMKQEV